MGRMFRNEVSQKTCQKTRARNFREIELMRHIITTMIETKKDKDALEKSYQQRHDQIFQII